MTDDLVPLLDRPEAATALHVSERTVRRYGKSGLLDERRIGPRLIRITEQSVRALMALQGHASNAPAGQVGA